MKKFLLTVTLVGVVISQIFSSSVAEAYNEGDRLDVEIYVCHNCKRKIYYMWLNSEWIQGDLSESGGCPFYNGGEHKWYIGGHRYYVYRNGQWVERDPGYRDS